MNWRDLAIDIRVALALLGFGISLVLVYAAVRAHRRPVVNGKLGTEQAALTSDVVNESAFCAAQGFFLALAVNTTQQSPPAQAQLAWQIVWLLLPFLLAGRGLYVVLHHARAFRVLWQGAR